MDRLTNPNAPHTPPDNTWPYLRAECRSCRRPVRELILALHGWGEAA